MKTGYHLSDFELIAMLVLLRLGEDAYGVPIAREIEEQTKREVKLGSVYAALERLEEKGFVASDPRAWGKSETLLPHHTTRDARSP
jgi:DNA-binding PadR family transcriptional regulator